MAITFTTTVANARQTDQMNSGLRVAHVRLTTTTGAGGADYSSGFSVGSNASKFGFTKVFTAIGLSARNGSGTQLADKVWFTWDDVNGKLRAWKADASAMTEDGGTNINANSVVDLLVLGV